MISISSYREDTKLFATLTKSSIKCSCGHSIFTIKPKQLCDWCGKYVYKDKRLEFEEKLKRASKKEEK